MRQVGGQSGTNRDQNAGCVVNYFLVAAAVYWCRSLRLVICGELNAYTVVEVDFEPDPLLTLAFACCLHLSWHHPF